MPPTTTQSLGIHQADLILESAIKQGIADLRADPHLLDWCFQSLAQDTLTSNTNGQLEIDNAREWFRKTDIPVHILKRDAPTFPCISLNILSSTEVESESTLGDTHSLPWEDNDDVWDTLAGPLDPLTYDPTKGILTFDPAALQGLVLAPGMVLLTRNGNRYPLLDSTASGSATIATRVADNFSQVVVKAAHASRLTELESSSFRETYAIGVHATSEPIHCIALHSILIFILLRYKQAYLEARGFERSTLDSQNLRLDEEAEELPEVVFSRYCKVSGYVRQYWPKSIALKITSTEVTVLNTDDQSNLSDGILAAPAGRTSSGATAPSQGQIAYWGAVPVPPGGYTAAWLQTLVAIQPAIGNTLLYSSGPGQYLFYAAPSTYGLVSGDFVDLSSEFALGVQQVATGVVVNGTAYDVWRSNQPNLGTLTIQIRTDD